MGGGGLSSSFPLKSTSNKVREAKGTPGVWQHYRYRGNLGTLENPLWMFTRTDINEYLQIDLGSKVCDSLQEQSVYESLQN